MNLLSNLPAPQGYQERPTWDGRHFRLGEINVPVLEYSENFAGWSDDLTALHEAASGENHPIDVASREFAIKRVREAIGSSDAVVMEIGCSSGYLIKILYAAFPNATVIGADVVREALFRLSKELPGVPLLRFDLLKCPLSEQSVDVIIMLNVLEHIENDNEALKSAWKLLRPGGKLVIEVPAGPELYDAYDSELHHFRRYSSGELAQKLSSAGFEVIQQSHLGLLIYPAFFLVKKFNRLFSRVRNLSIVRRQASATSGSRLVRWAMKLESKYLSGFRLPCGIRVIAVARRPS